jgi:hypothetical protein
MKIPLAAAFALAGWYLIVPARLSEWPSTYDLNAPLNQWKQVDSYDSAAECSEGKKKLSQTMVWTVQQMNGAEKQKALETTFAAIAALQCIATDDPRLKGN